MKCHPECRDTCRQLNDPRSCVDRCKNVKHFFLPGQKHIFECLAQCPPGYEPIKNAQDGQTICQTCKVGHYKTAAGKKLELTHFILIHLIRVIEAYNSEKRLIPKFRKKDETDKEGTVTSCTQGNSCMCKFSFSCQNGARFICTLSE